MLRLSVGSFLFSWPSLLAWFPTMRSILTISMDGETAKTWQEKQGILEAAIALPGADYHAVGYQSTIPCPLQNFW